jgi:hypothetical protein
MTALMGDCFMGMGTQVSEMPSLQIAASFTESGAVILRLH